MTSFTFDWLTNPSFYLYGALVYILIMFVGRIADGRFMEWIDWIQAKTGMSDATAGETIQATGTSAPEIMTNFAVLYVFPLLATGAAVVSPTIGLSTIIGSAIFQITVVIGGPMLYAKDDIQLDKGPVIRSSVVYAISVLLLLFFMYTGQAFSWWELAILALYHIAYVTYIIKTDKADHHAEPIVETEEEESEDIYMRVSNSVLPGPGHKMGLAGFFVVIFAIGVLCYFMVDFTEKVGTIMGLSLNFLALTVLAAGSSAPEIFSNIYLVKHGKAQQAIGNAVGSNTMDICISFAMVAIPVAIMRGGLAIEDEIMSQTIFSSLLLLVYVAIFIGMLWRSQWKITKKHAWILNAMFVFFVVVNVLLD